MKKDAALVVGVAYQSKSLEEGEEFPFEDDDDETNTVIENECDNDYTNIYQSLEDNENEEPEEIKR